MRPLNILFALTCLVLAVSGCSDTQSGLSATPTEHTISESGIAPTETGRVPEGWQRYEMLDAGLAIALPPSWKTITLDNQSLQAAVTEVAKISPNISARVERDLPRLLDTLRLWGFDAVSTAQYDLIPNVQVTKVHLPESMSLGLLGVAQVESIQRGFKDELVGKPSVEYLRIPAGRAQMIRFQLKFIMQSGEEVRLAGTQYILLKDLLRSETAYGIYFDSLADDDARY